MRALQHRWHQIVAARWGFLQEQVGQFTLIHAIVATY
jgi:hypothetical protein